jgi:hypothetical protein
MSVNLRELVASSALGLDLPTLSLVQPDLMIDELDSWTNPEGAAVPSCWSTKAINPFAFTSGIPVR